MIRFNKVDMAAVYILFSEKLNKYYVGSCLEISQRLADHKLKKYSDSYTRKADDWILFFSIIDLEYEQARLIESHIKKMKSKTYIENLKKYEDISRKLIEQYK